MYRHVDSAVYPEGNAVVENLVNFGAVGDIVVRKI